MNQDTLWRAWTMDTMIKNGVNSKKLPLSENEGVHRYKVNGTCRRSL
jgi:hypothetical protein